MQLHPSVIAAGPYLDPLPDLPLITLDIEVKRFKHLSVACQLMFGALYSEMHSDAFSFLFRQGEIHTFHQVQEHSESNQAPFLYAGLFPMGITFINSF